MKIKEYTSIYASLCERFIAQKRAIGYKYDVEERYLRYFDMFCTVREISSYALPKELVLAWVEKQPFEAERTREKRITIIQGFARFLSDNGYDAYILPPQKLRRRKNATFVPYIYTKQEISKIFHAADQMEKKAISPYIHIIIPILLRILYGCGLRISEAISLRVCDVDIEKGIITVMDSKFENCRLVPMSISLTAKCSEYINQIAILSDPDMPFFPNRYGEKVGVGVVYFQFRRILWQAGISHGGRGNGPRLHDFRHTFAVHSMRQLIANGKDFTVTSPILSCYMGHKCLESTQNYLRITADAYTEIFQKIEDTFGSVIPGRTN